VIPDIRLNDGTTIPQLGFGTYLVPPEETAEVVGHALEVGYRHIDTAQMYRNEAGVGDAIAASGIPRDELYITTKLANRYHRPEDVHRSFERSLERLGLEQVDLFLMHWPLPTQFGGDYVSTWAAMTELLDGGRLRSVGVSNFQPAHLDRIVADTGVAPVINHRSRLTRTSATTPPAPPRPATARRCRRGARSGRARSWTTRSSLRWPPAGGGRARR
jgi:2,5-diketo-D-gluconate reductase A